MHPAPETDSVTALRLRPDVENNCPRHTNGADREFDEKQQRIYRAIVCAWQISRPHGTAPIRR